MLHGGRLLLILLCRLCCGLILHPELPVQFTRQLFVGLRTSGWRAGLSRDGRIRRALQRRCWRHLRGDDWGQRVEILCWELNPLAEELDVQLAQPAECSVVPKGLGQGRRREGGQETSDRAPPQPTNQPTNQKR